MTTTYHTPIPSSPPQPANAATINGPLAELDAELVAQDARIGDLETAVPEPSGNPTEYYDGDGNWTVPAGTGASVDGHVIQNEGVDLVQRAKIDFVGDGVTVTNETGGTQVSIPGGVTDHGALTGLGDDDHSQYHNDTRGDARYLQKTGLSEWDEQASDPSTPAASKWKLFFKADGLYIIDDAGTVDGPISGAAPVDNSTESYVFDASIATSDLTVALKRYDGTDPSVSYPLKIPVGSAILEITSALSVTITDTMGDIFLWDAGKIQGNDAQLFVYIIDNNGTPQLGLSPSPLLRTVATNYFDTGAGSQTGSAAFNNIVMSGTRNATNSCRVIGRINVKQSDANAWQAPTTALLVNYPIFTTDWMTWTPQHSRAGGAYTNLPTQSTAIYMIDNQRMDYIEVHTQNATPGSSGAQRITAPVVCQSGNTGNGLNANSLAGIQPFLSSGTNTISMYKSSDGSAECTASNTYTISGSYRLPL